MLCLIIINFHICVINKNLRMIVNNVFLVNLGQALEIRSLLMHRIKILV